VTSVVAAPSTASRERRRPLVLAGLLPATLCAGLALLPPAALTWIDLDVYDSLLRMASFAPPVGRIAIVDVDERSVSTVGQWPWRRDVMAHLITRLRALGASTIALDIVFSEADRRDTGADAKAPDVLFAEALRAGQVVMGYAFTFGETSASPEHCVLHPLRLTLVEPAGGALEPPLFRATDALCSLPVLAEAAGASGFLNASPDADGIVRRVPLVLDFHGRTYPGLALAAVLSAKAPDTGVLRAANAQTTTLEVGALKVPLDGRSNLLLRYRGHNRTFPYISATDVLSGSIPTGALEGKLVFVGTTALGMQEFVASPFDRLFTGIEVQATIADNLLRGDFLRRPEHAVILQTVMTLAAGIIIALVIGRAGVVRGCLAVLAGLIALWGMTAWLLSAYGIFLSPLVPSIAVMLSVGAVVVTAVSSQMRAAFVEVQRARRASEEALQARHNFLLNLSHELRTPLNAIYGYAQILTRSVMRDDQQNKAVASIERNARAQARVIDDLLQASETATGTLRLDVKDVDLGGIVRSVVDVLRPAIDAKRLSLDVEIDSGLRSIAGDSDRLRQVVWHLVSNAIKFTPEGGRVGLRVDKTRSSAQFTVTDNGAGIAPEFLPLLFEPFQQQDTSTTRQHGGLGLGLSLVRHIVELHGGEVTAESDGAGHGATFQVRLPVRIPEPLNPRTPEPPNPGTLNP
jgi:signal transduction histidine kinase